MRVVWDLPLWWNFVWTGACLLLVGGVVLWATAHSFRTAWHRANAEAMTLAVEETAQVEATCEAVALVEETVARLHERLRGTRAENAGMESDADPGGEHGF